MSFVHAASPRALRFPVEHRGDKLPLRIRTALIGGSAAALWAVVLIAGYYIVTALV
ncbi:MAG: hypothetical protein JWL84_3195 [Rhodospirillales bacterium]|jgi:hypothetical protein|nr:hypothetical protein [Rhodospirillales bacterium]